MRVRERKNKKVDEEEKKEGEERRGGAESETKRKKVVNGSPLLQGTHPLPLSLFSIHETDGVPCFCAL